MSIYYLAVACFFAQYIFMAYHARRDILKNGDIFHITWRCHNKEYYLRREKEKYLYYKLLVKYVKLYGVDIYRYCLMSNHVHLVGKCEEVARLSACMNIVNSMFARTINKRLGRCGQVIMDRYKSTVIGDNIELLKVSRYVELNPYKAGMVIHPKNYKWSSYNHYANGITDELLVEDPSFIDMGATDEERRSNYISFIMEYLEAGAAKKKVRLWSINYLGPEIWAREKKLILKEVARIKRMNKGKNKIKILKRDVIEVT